MRSLGYCNYALNPAETCSKPIRSAVTPHPLRITPDSAFEPEICRLRAAAARDRNDVVDLQEEARAAAPPGMPVDVGAAT